MAVIILQYEEKEVGRESEHKSFPHNDQFTFSQISEITLCNEDAMSLSFTGTLAGSIAQPKNMLSPGRPQLVISIRHPLLVLSSTIPSRFYTIAAGYYHPGSWPK